MRLLTILCLVLLSSCSQEYESFYENGQLRTRGNFIDEKQDGLWERFYDDGQLASRRNFIDGVQNGLWEEFYPDGQLVETIMYSRGVIVEPPRSNEELRRAEEGLEGFEVLIEQILR